MGKRMGITKSGRIMNPADRERKQMRMKELKRNKKERVKIRQAIVKSRNPHELIDHLERLDSQEFDLNNELALNVIADKRSKYKGAFIQMISLYRTEKEDKKVKELESMLHDYELERLKKEQHYKAQLFSNNADPDEIPLPMGTMAPNAALTPFAPPPVPPQFHPTMRAGILKKPVQVSTKKHKYPPGPPCGLPPSLSDDEDEEQEQVRTSSNRMRSRRVQFNEPSNNEGEDDYGPVDIPESMLNETDKASTQGSQSAYNRGAVGGRLLPPPNPHALIPPGMAPLPPRLPPHFSGVAPSGYSSNAPMMRGGGPSSMYSRQQNGSDEPNSSAIISAGPQVNKPIVDLLPVSGPIISAAPQMRNIKKETTRFVPTTLKVSRPAPPVIRPKPQTGGPGFFPHKPNSTTTQKQQPPVRSTDEACDEFLREIQDLL